MDRISIDRISLIHGITHMIFGIIFAVAATFRGEVAAQAASIAFIMLSVNDICEAFVYGDDDGDDDEE